VQNKDELVGKRIQELMDEQKTNARDLGRGVGITDSQLYHILNGRVTVRPDLAIRIADFLRVPMDTIYTHLEPEEDSVVRVRALPGISTAALRDEFDAALEIELKALEEKEALKKLEKK
jgi:transcriptional regulator with XRE-family HTH domain